MRQPRAVPTPLLDTRTTDRLRLFPPSFALPLRPDRVSGPSGHEAWLITPSPLARQRTVPDRNLPPSGGQRGGPARQPERARGAKETGPGFDTCPSFAQAPVRFCTCCALFHRRLCGFAQPSGEFSRNQSLESRARVNRRPVGEKIALWLPSLPVIPHDRPQRREARTVAARTIRGSSVEELDCGERSLQPGGPGSGFRNEGSATATKH